MRTNEIWKPVVGYEKAYHVSNLGRVKSLPKLRRRTTKILVPQKLRTGYEAVDLGNGSSIKRFSIHRLVASAFIPNPEGKPQTNHKNGIKDDNRVENLEWVTASENQKHAIRTGLRSAKGPKNSQAKLSKWDVLTIRALHKTEVKHIRLARIFDVSPSTICDIVYRRSWKHV